MGGDQRALQRVSSTDRDEHWRAEKGELFLEWTEDGVVVMRLEGHGDGRFGAVINRRLDAVLARAGRIVFLVDAWDMPTYDSPLRTDVTGWCVQHRPQIRKIHVAVRSKLVAMGVAVANVALGGLIRAHSERPPFDAILREHGVGPLRS